MAAPLFLFPNLCDAPTVPLPGASIVGSTSWALPLTHLQNRRLALPARSLSLSPADTTFDVVFNGFEEIRGFALVNHNFSLSARLRATAWYPEGSYYAPDFQTEIDAYPTVAFADDLPMEAENWWDRKPLTRDIYGLTQDIPFVLPKPTYAPHWRFEIIDPENAKGYAQFARLIMATGWQVSQAMERSPTLRYEDESEVEVAESGAEFIDERPTFRVFNLGFRMLPREEALHKGLGMMRQAGIKRDLYFIHDPDDVQNLQAMSFYARFRSLKDWEWVTYPKANIAFELKELL